MAGDKREFILDLLARDKSGPATKSFGKNIKDVGDDAEKADRKVRGFGKSTTTASKEADQLGDQLDGTARSMGKLDREIALASAELRVLAKSFADTDDAAERLDISKGIRKGENDLRRLNKAKSLIKIDVEPNVDSAGFAKKLMAGISGAGGSIASAASGSVGPVVGGAIGAAAAPVLVSAMASALSAGAGLGVLGGGIALAVKKDNGIQAAGSALGVKFMDGLTKSATRVFGGPIRSALGILEDASARSVGKISKSFEALGPSVVPFTRDIVQGGERILTALTNVASKSGPALDGLGKSIRLVSDGVGDFVETLADGGPEAAANLTLIAGATADLLRYTGTTLDSLNKLASNEWITGPLLPLLRKHYQEAAAESDTMAGSTTKLADEMTTAEKAANGERTALSELSKELRAQTDPVFALLNAEDTLAEKQKTAAKATKEHGAKSKEAKTALRELAEAALDVEGKAGALGATFNGKLTPQLKASLRAAGLTETQIDQLGGQFKDAKKDGDKFAKTYAANVKVRGVKPTKDALYGVRDAANSIPRAVTIAMRITGQTNVSKVAAGIRKQYDARATGGPISKDTPYWVGENGPELVFPNHDGRVLSAAASRASAAHSAPALSGLGGGGGMSGQRLRLEFAGQQEVVTMFRALIRKADILQDDYR